jgi:hypothetical protein
LLSSLDHFDRLAEEVLQGPMDFSQHLEECGVHHDFNFVISENHPPAGVDLSDPKQKVAWSKNPNRFLSGNLFKDPSLATMQTVLTARHYIYSSTGLLAHNPVASTRDCFHDTAVPSTCLVCHCPYSPICRVSLALRATSSCIVS